MVFNKNVSKSDIFYTPDWIIDLLVPYLSIDGYNTVWEPACGQNHIVNRLVHHGYNVVGTDITDDGDNDFIVHTGWVDFDIIITNPPFSSKDAFIRKCIEYKKPFALLLPISSLEGKTRSKLWQQCEDLSVIIPDKRVNFIGQSGSPNFCSAWFCNGFNLGKQIIFINTSKDLQNNDK
jgi:type I restriction-modification system DNA methylase subunit